MSTSAQARLDRLFRNKPKPQVQNATDQQAFWEKELIGSQQQEQSDPPIEAERLSIQQGRTQTLSQSEHTSSSNQDTPDRSADPTNGHAFIVEPTQAVYLPNGKNQWQPPTAGLGNIQIDDGPEVEPGSSSTKLIGQFCIFSQVAKFPYKYMSDPGSIVSRRFFAAEKVYERNWKMHYLTDTESYNFKPLMLVPIEQVQMLIREIGQEFQMEIGVPEYPFQLSFYNDGTPPPVSLGIINSKQDMADLQARISDKSDDDDRQLKCLAKADINDQAAWKEKIARAFEAEKMKKGKGKKASQKQAMTISENLNSLVRAQRYLGLGPPLSRTETITSEHIIQSQSTAGYGNQNMKLDVTTAAPFPFEEETVLISIDIESWESDHSIITEIGLSTLDTTDIKGSPIGPAGEEWIKEIRSRHFRVEGREHLTNYKYVQGCPDMFRFGDSEFVSLKEAPKMVDNCFEHPFSAAFRFDGLVKNDKEHLTSTCETVATLEQTHSEPNPRKLLLVGHDLNTDIAYLSSLGSSIFGISNDVSTDGAPSRRQRVLSSIRECVDTATLYKTLTKDEQPRSLMKMCSDLGITPWHAHNAGNDARYTLEAFIKLVIKSRQIDDDAMSGHVSKTVDTEEDFEAY